MKNAAQVRALIKTRCIVITLKIYLVWYYLHRMVNLSMIRILAYATIIDNLFSGKFQLYD